MGEPCAEWRCAPITEDALSMYMGVKFSQWRKQLDSPTCEAEFRRLLQNGLVAKLYDHMLFPTPEGLLDKYRVTDDRNGKALQIPHPVSGLRIWNPATSSYKTVDPRLPGAPSPGQEEKYWEDTLSSFRAERGHEYIDGLLGKE